MFKLRSDGTTVRVEDYTVLLNTDTSNEFTSSMNKLNMDAFFDKKHPNDIILWDLKSLSYTITIDKAVVDLLSQVKSVKYQFINCLTDAPQDNQSIDDVEIEIPNIRKAIETYAEWCIYSMINYLPYADFALDHMPTIDKVYINGVESDLFENITKYLNDILDDTYNFDILRDGSYNTCYGKYSIEKDKKIYMSFYRVNTHFPVFFYSYKFYRKALRKLDHIEITLRWYEGKYNDERDYTVYADSIADDYMYSDTTFESNLTLATVLPYLYQYYNHELKYMRDNHFLITVATVYHKTKNGLAGLEIVDPNSKFVFSYILDTYCKYINK